MGALDQLKDSALSVVGGNKKAILEIADFSERTDKEKAAQKPASGKASLGSLGSLDQAANIGGFSTDSLQSYSSGLANSALGTDKNGKGFTDYKNIKRYRFEVQFNPEEIYINGYGGEELPIVNFQKRKKGDPHGNEHGQEQQEDDVNQAANQPPLRGSHMASAATRIEMSFKLIFDQVNIMDAFYADKFTLSTTNIVKGIGTGIKSGIGAIKGKGKAGHYTVQTEVEALTAIVRDPSKRLARFAWGDMAYEGVINHVSAEYNMFNINGEPIRAFVNVSMILYDAEVSGANTNIWKNEYNKDFGSSGNPVTDALHANI